MVRRLAPRGGARERLSEELEARLGELDQVKRRLGELEERVDLAERMLAQQRDVGRLPPPKD
jgi:predicted nuclease with TOPRIM domain